MLDVGGVERTRQESKTGTPRCEVTRVANLPKNQMYSPFEVHGDLITKSLRLLVGSVDPLDELYV